jgi:hypothetical protein
MHARQLMRLAAMTSTSFLAAPAERRRAPRTRNYAPVLRERRRAARPHRHS